MKRVLSLLLVLVMLLCLCACSRIEAQNTDLGIHSGQDITDNKEDSTGGNTEDEQAPTKKPSITTKPDQDTTDNIEKPTIGTTEDTQDPNKKPTAPPSEDTTIPPSGDTTIPPTDTPTTKPGTCSHSYTNVTCTTPKICTKCNDIAGNALPHNYENGSCTVCGRAEMLVTFREGYWVAYTVKDGTSEQGEILSEYVLDPTLQRYSSYVCYSNASACSVSTGKIIYNDKAYHSDWYFTVYMGCTHKENGNTITITVENKDNPYSFDLTKTNETQLAVVSSTNTAYVPVGIVFNKA